MAEEELRMSLRSVVVVVMVSYQAASRHCTLGQSYIHIESNQTKLGLSVEHLFHVVDFDSSLVFEVFLDPLPCVAVLGLGQMPSSAHLTTMCTAAQHCATACYQSRRPLRLENP